VTPDRGSRATKPNPLGVVPPGPPDPAAAAIPHPRHGDAPLPEDVIERRADLLAQWLREELAARWPEKYGHLTAEEAP
jgi:hypothetical protein